MKKSDIQIPIPGHYNDYLALVEDLPLKAALDKGLTNFQNFDWDKVKAIGDQTYAPEKWTIKEIIQHVIDWERIFTYRALVHVRLDENRPMPHDQNWMAANSNANRQSWEQLQNEFHIVRHSTIALFQSFDKADLVKKAYSMDQEINVAIIGFLLVGHQAHHFKVIEERYFPLLGR